MSMVRAFLLAATLATFATPAAHAAASGQSNAIVDGTWQGTEQEYFKLYEIATKAIKAHDPSLKVGGPVPFDTEPFLTYCRDRKLPLDFFAWHYYTDAPQELARVAVLSRCFGQIRFQECGEPSHRMALHRASRLVRCRTGGKHGSP